MAVREKLLATIEKIEGKACYWSTGERVFPTG
jgi:hypothetical protein